MIVNRSFNGNNLQATCFCVNLTGHKNPPSVFFLYLKVWRNILPNIKQDRTTLWITVGSIRNQSDPGNEKVPTGKLYQLLLLKSLKRRCYQWVVLQKGQSYFLLNLCSNVQKLTYVYCLLEMTLKYFHNQLFHQCLLVTFETITRRILRNFLFHSLFNILLISLK